MISSLTLPFNTLHVGPNKDSTKRGNLGGVTSMLNARTCTHLHFNVNGRFPHNKRVSFILKRFASRSLGAVSRQMRLTKRVVGDFYLTNVRVAVGRFGGGWDVNRTQVSG